MDEDIATSAATRSNGRRAELSTIRIGIYQPKVSRPGHPEGLGNVRRRICGSSRRSRSKAASVRNAEAMYGKIPDGRVGPWCTFPEPGT